LFYRFHANFNKCATLIFETHGNGGTFLLLWNESVRLAATLRLGLGWVRSGSEMGLAKMESVHNRGITAQGNRSGCARSCVAALKREAIVTLSAHWNGGRIDLRYRLWFSAVAITTNCLSLIAKIL
jgi:hypothetical protein